MRVAIGADHAGFYLKEEIKKYLEKQGIEVEDYGTDSDKSVDYPQFAIRVSRTVSNNKNQLGILVCGSGIGMSIVANKIPGIRCACSYSVEMAKMSRSHNNANILSLAARFTELEEAKEIVTVFIHTKFEAGTRHERRVKQIHDLTGL